MPWYRFPTESPCSPIRRWWHAGIWTKWCSTTIRSFGIFFSASAAGARSPPRPRCRRTKGGAVENRAYALAAGLFTVVLAAALGAAGLWFRRDNIQFAHYVVTTESSVAGLKVEAPVRYRGVDVGRVESIRIEPGVSGRISIRIGVQEDAPITRSTYAQLGYQGVTGLAYVALNDEGASKELLKAEGGEPRGSRRGGALLQRRNLAALERAGRAAQSRHALARPGSQRRGRESAEFRVRRPASKARTGRAGIQGRSALRHMLRSSRRIAALTLVLAGAGCSQI